MAHRYFTSEINGQHARISGSDAAHLARVLRVQPGAHLTLCDGAGFDYEAEVLLASPEEVQLRVLEKQPSTAEPALWAEAFIGMAKGERMDLAVQKAVELGASAIHPFYSANIVVKPKNDAEKAARYGRIAAEAAKQCGRGMLPQVSLPCPFAEVLQQAAAFPLALFFYEAGGVPLRQAWQGQQRVAIITGAEGGFTPQEAAQAEAAGCLAVGLGPRILRSETAPAAALAVLMALSGNMEG